MSLMPPGKLKVGVTEVPFSLGLRSTTGLELMETYHGAHILISYLLKSLDTSRHILSFNTNFL